MCLQITYTLTCEHVKTEIKFCADAIPVHADTASSASVSASSSSKRSSSSSSSKKRRSHAPSSSSSSSSPMPNLLPCVNLQQIAQPYPTPPSFAGDPQTAAASLLAPKCPLPDCPFESKNRLWNCCWCGKAWNEYGRCSCTMIIEGNYVQCEHICCPECEAASR